MKRAFTKNQEQAILEMQADGYPIRDIVVHFGSINAVYSLFRREGVILQCGGLIKMFVSQSERESIITLWGAGDSVTAIMRKIPRSREIIRRVLHEEGIEIVKRLSTSSREAHWGWLGGRVLTAKGYIGISLKHDDPYKDMSNGQYALEHRVFMARHLGRRLRSDETVHHLNGDRTDNRIENLQLRQGHHGVGIKYGCGDCGSHNVIPVEI